MTEWYKGKTNLPIDPIVAERADADEAGYLHSVGRIKGAIADTEKALREAGVEVDRLDGQKQALEEISRRLDDGRLTPQKLEAYRVVVRGTLESYEEQLQALTHAVKLNEDDILRLRKSLDAVRESLM